MSNDYNFKKLISMAINGDEEGYSGLIEITKDRFYKFCLYLCADEHLAFDICQDTYVKVLEKIQDFESLEKFTSWLFKVGKNQYLDFIKTPKNQSLAYDELQSSQISEFSFDEDNKLHVREALSLVRPEYRTLLILVDIEGYSYMEAAKILEISEPAVRSRLHQARQEFVNKFNKK